MRQRNAHETPKHNVKKSIAMVLKGYPRLSETFIAQEIRELEKRGFDITLYSLRHPYDPDTHPVHAEIVASVNYLPEYLHDEPARVFRAFGGVLGRAVFWQTAVRFIRDFARDPTRNRIRRFGQAMVLARETPSEIDHYYAHFMHTPASVTRYAALLTGRTWSISAHAKDIWTIPEWEKREKLDSAEWLVTCTRANFTHLQQLSEPPGKVNLVYHGLDFERFGKPPQRASGATGRTPDATVKLLSVGRTVEKKGYEYLLQALARLPPDCHWFFTHIGGGERSRQLQNLARQLNLDDRIEWRGAQPQSEVLQAFRAADLFVLPSIVGHDGDRDGLPNVLMEAQSQQLACLATDISGIPELIKQSETGWLVPQKNIDALHEALTLLIGDSRLRQEIGRAGYQRVTHEFSHTSCINRLESLLSG